MPVSKHRRWSKGGRVRQRPRYHDGQSIVRLTNEPGTIERLHGDLKKVASEGNTTFQVLALMAAMWRAATMAKMAGWVSPRMDESAVGILGVLLCDDLDNQALYDDQSTDFDSLIPPIASALRPYCPHPTFSAAWENEGGMAPGALKDLASRAREALTKR